VELDLRLFKGNILIEMFGGIFPRVGELPYLADSVLISSIGSACADLSGEARQELTEARLAEESILLLTSFCAS
jgi:hypothetical protein